jgi:uncharacterized repeat protein (TIGR01451 family)
VPQGGTPLVALITDAIDGTEPKFVNQRHLESLIAGNRNCGVVRPVSSGVQPVENHFYDEYFFFNSSSTSETVLVGFNPSCSVVAFTAAYAPGFDPNNICENFIASQGFAGPRNWEFTVCAGSRFSIVVYNHRADTACPSYVLEVFGNNMTFLGTVDDLAVSKTVASRSGSAVNYNITVTNNGPNPARNFTIVDPLPAGTTFLSLNPGGASCTTPPVGAGGTVSCSVPLLAAPGTNLPTSLTILLSLTITPQAGALVTNTVTVSRFGIDPNPSNNTASSVVATSCLQDDATGSVLSIDVGTGDYQFSNCHGVTITGRGIVKVKGCMITLQHFGIDRRVQAHIDTCQKRGTGLVQIVSTGVTFPLTDRNTVNNTCVCTGG